MLNLFVLISTQNR